MEIRFARLGRLVHPSFALAFYAKTPSYSSVSHDAIRKPCSSLTPRQSEQRTVSAPAFFPSRIQHCTLCRHRALKREKTCASPALCIDSFRRPTVIPFCLKSEVRSFFATRSSGFTASRRRLGSTRPGWRSECPCSCNAQSRRRVERAYGKKNTN